jgi:hypothetical protein
MNDVPEAPPAGEPQPGEPKIGSVGAGVLVGGFALYALYISATLPLGGPTMWSSSYLRGALAFVPLAYYLLMAILLAVRRRTSGLGAGLLIGFGIFILLGGGLCVGALVQAGT